MSTKSRATAIWLVVLAAVAIGGLVWFQYLRPSAPAPASAPLPAATTPEPATPQPPVDWDALVPEVPQMAAGQLREHAQRFFRAGDADRAFLLFKHAAKKGDGPSALAIAEMYDPATFAADHFDPQTTAFSKPNSRKALEWYQKALDAGVEAARAPQEKLITVVQTAAATGDRDAQRILKRLK